MGKKHSIWLYGAAFFMIEVALSLIIGKILEAMGGYSSGISNGLGLSLAAMLVGLYYGRENREMMSFKDTLATSTINGVLSVILLATVFFANQYNGIAFLLAAIAAFGLTLLGGGIMIPLSSRIAAHRAGMKVEKPAAAKKRRKRRRGKKK